MRRALLILLAGTVGLAQDEEPQAPPPSARDTGLTGVLSEEGFKALHELTGEKRPAPKGTMVEVGGMQAYLSLPKGEPPFPAITVIHEWWGLNEHIKHWGDRLAADGYAALAVDLYGGKVATNRDDAMAYMKGVDETKGAALLKAAHAFLKDDPRIRAKRRGCVGWCFGGGWSLHLALEAPDLDAAVIYYGRLVTDPEKLKAIQAPLLGVFGNEDTGIPPEKVNEFDDALKAAGVKYEILRYDAPHAFANPSSARYDAKSAEDAWKRVRAFFGEHLKK